ncbi:UDP-N-acetylmuramoyl-tripeptide--D-alanyl-D-alanine ligase [Aurantivibrio plasticivorans]
MMRSFSLIDIATATRGRLTQNSSVEIKRVSTDTRSVREGDLFVALRGENFDAHDFVGEAERKGAAAVVVSNELDLGIPQVVVIDTTEALGNIAHANRLFFNKPLIGITGSCGKTSVKSLLTDILSGCGRVLATKGNFNNHIGVPLTLFDLQPEHDFAVIEMGASGPNEIGYLAGIAKPTIGLITNALRAHVEGFGGIEGVAKAKGQMYSSLDDADIAVLNKDDPAYVQWCELVGDRRSLTFSLEDDQADFYATNLAVTERGQEFDLCSNGEVHSITLQLLGSHNVANALAASACAYAAGADLLTIKTGLESSEAVAGRMQVLDGVHGAAIIDDSYNANPDSVRAAINALAQRAGRTVFVLGDLAELGSETKPLHAELGQYAKEQGVSNLLTVGELTASASNAFGVNSEHFSDQAELIARLKSILGKQTEESTTVLVKGSRVSHMERVVTALLRDGEE